MLGTPIGRDTFITTFLNAKLTDFTKTINAFTPLQTQSALLLLQHCGINRLNHLWRTVPMAQTNSIAARAADVIWAAVSAILGLPNQQEADKLHIQLNRARELAELPLNKGGLGIISPLFTLPGAALAGLRDGLRLVKTHFPSEYELWSTTLDDNNSGDIDYNDITTYATGMAKSMFMAFKKTTARFNPYKETAAFKNLKNIDGEPLSPPEIAKRFPLNFDDLMESDGKVQATLADMAAEVKTAAVRDKLRPSLLALLNGQASPHAADFLVMHPQSHFHKLSNADMKFAARTHIFIPPTNEIYTSQNTGQLLINEPNYVPDAFVSFRDNARDTHAWPRHNALTNIFIHILRKMGHSVRGNPRVPIGQTRGEADFLVYGLHDNQDVAFDVSVTASDCVSTATQAAARAGVAAEVRAKQKRNKYEDTCKANGIAFQPLIFEDSGFIHSSVHTLLSHLHGSDAFEMTVPELTTWVARSPRDFWYQGLSKSLVAGSAQMFRAARAQIYGHRAQFSRTAPWS